MDSIVNYKVEVQEFQAEEILNLQLNITCMQMKYRKRRELYRKQKYKSIYNTIVMARQLNGD